MPCYNSLSYSCICSCFSSPQMTGIVRKQLPPQLKLVVRDELFHLRSCWGIVDCLFPKGSVENPFHRALVSPYASSEHCQPSSWMVQLAFWTSLTSTASYNSYNSRLMGMQNQHSPQNNVPQWALLFCFILSICRGTQLSQGTPKSRKWCWGGRSHQMPWNFHCSLSNHDR